MYSNKTLPHQSFYSDKIQVRQTSEQLLGGREAEMQFAHGGTVQLS